MTLAKVLCYCDHTPSSHNNIGMCMICDCKNYKSFTQNCIFCPLCGKQIPETDTGCSRCGWHGYVTTTRIKKEIRLTKQESSK